MKTSFVMVFRVVGAVFVAVTILALVGLGLGWFKAGTDIVSPDNVKAQWQFAYDYNEKLKAIADNVCGAQKAYNAETDSNAKTQRMNQLLAQENLYRLRQSDYDAALADAFRAKLVKPPDVPDKAPTLQEELTAVGCTVPVS